MIDKFVFIFFVLILLEVPFKILILYILGVGLYLNRHKIIKEKFEVPITNQNLMGNSNPTQPVYSPDTNAKLQKFLSDNQDNSIRAFYSEDIFRPLEDYFDKKDGYRQFIPNPEISGSLADSYRNMPSCKDNPEYCFAYVDQRHH